MTQKKQIWEELFGSKVEFKKFFGSISELIVFILYLLIYSLCWRASFSPFHLNEYMEMALSPSLPPLALPTTSLPLLSPRASVCFCMAPGCLEAVCICMGEMVDRDGIWHAGTRSKRSIWSHKNRRGPFSHPYKTPADSQPCQPTTPPSSPRLGSPSPPPAPPPPHPPPYSHPPPSLSDFAITPCDKQRPRLAHKAGVLCIMLTIKDSISSLILFTSPAVARPASASINIAGRGWVTQMRTCICWSKESRITAKSVYERSRKTKQIKKKKKFEHEVSASWQVVKVHFIQMTLSATFSQHTCIEIKTRVRLYILKKTGKLKKKTEQHLFKF